MTKSKEKLKNLDVNFLSSLLDSSSDAITILMDHKIDESLIKPALRPVFTYIIQFYKDFGKLPERETVEKHFDSFYVEPKENLKFYINELRNRERYSIARVLSQQIATLFAGETGEHHLEYTDKAEQYIYDAAKRLAIDLSSASLRDYIATSENRIEEYLKRERGDEIFVPTPWHPFNDNVGGWTPGSFNSIVADTGIGKSWSMAQCALTAMHSGYKCAIFTEEMSKEEFENRLDALECKLPYKRFKKGQLNLEEKERYFKYLKQNKNRLDSLIIVEGIGSGGFTAIQSYCDQIQPDIIFVDGIYLYAKDYDWKNVATVIKDAKEFAMRNKIPVVATNQINEQGKFAFSKAILRDSHYVIKMIPVEDLVMMAFELIKHRESEALRWCCDWDFEIMEFGVQSDIDPESSLSGYLTSEEQPYAENI